MPEIIVKNPKIFSGKPVIKGTRIPVARVLALIGLEYSLKQMQKEIPDLASLTEKDIKDILSYYESQHGQKAITQTQA